MHIYIHVCLCVLLHLGDMIQDLKTGHILHASPRAQFFGQIIGTCFSILISVGAFQLYNSIYEVRQVE